MTRISIWRNRGGMKRNRHWHLCSDPSGCVILREHIDRVRQLEVGQQTLLKLQAPTKAMVAIPGRPGGDDGLIVPGALVLENAESEWTMESIDQSVVIRSGETGWTDFAVAVHHLSQGGGDYCIGGRKQLDRLWFWPSQWART